MKRVIVIGAGLAGLSAAIRLADAGNRVTVLERSSELGGRARRIRTPGSGEQYIDFGQHLLLGCYHETFRLARRLGTGSALEAVEGPTPFLTGPGRVHPYRVGRLPAPFHAIGGIKGLDHLGMLQRLNLGRAAAAAKIGLRLSPDRLDRLSATQWLKNNGQGPDAMAGFWEPMVLATLNLPPSEASALLLATVIDRGFVSSRGDAVPFLARDTLYDAFIGPAVGEIRRLKGRVARGVKVEALEDAGSGRISAAVASKGVRFEADSFVLAVPNWHFVSLVGGLPGMRGAALNAEALGFNPIVSVEMWFDRHWMEYRFAGLLGSPVQWVFDHPGSDRVSAVISSAGDLYRRRNEALISMCVDEICRFFPEAAGAGLVSAMVIRAPRATFRGSPGQAALRMTAATPYDNLFLAGDWTATGLPATIEGAVASGRAAADQVALA